MRMFKSANQRRDALEQRRMLHARIARSRRRLTGRTARLLEGGFLPVQWRQQIQDHPLMALATAAGVGMLLAQCCAGRSAVGKTGDGLAQWLAGKTWSSWLKHLEPFLSVSRGETPSGTESAADPPEGA